MAFISKISHGGQEYDIRDKVLAIMGEGAPTTATVGTIGQLYIDTVNGEVYHCKAIAGGVYTWEEVGTDAILYSTTGQNTDGAMTQKATTDELNKINVLIPEQADEDNQLADKEFVNSSIATSTATFRGTYDKVEDLPTTGVDINDYAFVRTTDEVGNQKFDRYKYTTEWVYEYTLNNSSFTAVQWAAINSGATEALIGQITTNQGDIADLEANKQDNLIAGANITIAADGKTIAAVDTTYEDATTTVHGLMSTADKAKLDGIAAGAEVNVQSDWTQTDTTADDYIKNVPADLVEDADYVHTDNNYTTAEKTKLAGIEAGAEVNVQADWEVADSTSDAFIKNKPANLVQDANYVHTDNNYTTPEKTKLAGIADGAEVNVQSDWNQTDTTADDYIKNVPANIVTDADYVHTDNNYTDAEKSKLAGVAAGAQVNVIETVKVNGTAQTVTNKAVDIDVPVISVNGETLTIA